MEISGEEPVTSIGAIDPAGAPGCPLVKQEVPTRHSRSQTEFRPPPDFLYLLKSRGKNSDNSLNYKQEIRLPLSERDSESVN